MSSTPFTDVEMMVISQLSYKDPYIKAKEYNLSLYDMLVHEEEYLIDSLGEDKSEIIDNLKQKVFNKDYYVVDSTNDKHGTGFSALAIQGPEKGTLTVACRGTEGFGFGYDSTKDVLSDAQLGFETQTNQQFMMDKFMERFESYDSIYLTGHSLGGNLAVSGAIGFYDPSKIKGVVTFNCPGQNSDFIAKNALKIHILQNKIKNYQNKYDIVSDINIPIGQVIVVESCKKGVADTHLQGGFDISGGGFTMVPGNTKSAGHIAGQILMNILVTVADESPALKLLIYNGVILIGLVVQTVEKVQKLLDWCSKNLNPGYKYAQSHPQIVVDTAKLRGYAERLSAVNKRITKLGGRIDSLYGKVGLLDLWNLMQADLLTGYSIRLTLCASYLNETAKDFEDAESAILGSL